MIQFEIHFNISIFYLIARNERLLTFKIFQF